MVPREKTRVLVIDNLVVESAKRTVFRELGRSGEFEVDLLAPASWKEQGEATVCEQEVESTIRVHETGLLFGYRQHRVVYTHLARMLHEVRPHFLYIDTEPENYGALECYVAVRLFSPRAKLGLVSSRTIDYLNIGFPYKAGFTHRLCDTVIRRNNVDVIFVRPRSALRYMRQYALRVYHLPHPVDCRLFRKLERPRVQSELEPVTLGFLGRLVESKGIDLLVKALPNLPERVRLLVVGNGPMLRTLQRLALAHGVLGRVEFRPAVPYAHVPRILNNMDILVLPSLETKFWTEQFGRVLIEAMACEVPIIASRSGEIPEVLGDAGLLFEMGNLHDLVEKTRSLILDAHLRNELAARGRARAVTLYDAPVVAQKIATAIRESLETRAMIEHRQ